jgi:beta-lactamase regulating signal transducer with metallopeptidase domain
MSANSVLYIAAAFVGFLLKTSLYFVAVGVVTRLIRSASYRFALWMAYLAGTAIYWVGLLFVAVELSPFGNAAGSSTETTAATAMSHSIFPAWVISQAWGVYAGSGLRVLSCLYVSVLGIALLMHIRKHVRLRRMLTFAYSPDVDLGRLCDGIAAGLAIRRYRLLILPGLPSPATVGWLHPTVLLPSPCEEQSADELSDVIRHELYHIKRRDYLLGGIAHVFRVMLFFHPVAWLLYSRLRLEREIACDQAVVRSHPENRARYAECLVRFARRSSIDDNHVFGIDFAAESGHLHTRIQSILAMSSGHSWWEPSLKGACSAAVVAGVVALLPSLTVGFTFAPSHTENPLLTMKVRPKSAVSKKARRSTPSVQANVQQALSHVGESNHGRAIPFAVTGSEAPTKPHYVLTPAAGTEDESQTVSGSASDQTEIGPLSGNPGVGRTRVPGPSSQSVTSAVTGAMAQLSRGGHGDHDKD